MFGEPRRCPSEPRRSPDTLQRTGARGRRWERPSYPGLSVVKKKGAQVHRHRPASAPLPARSRYLPVASFGHLLPRSRDNPTEALASAQLAATERRLRALVEALAEG
jgi:hypothetical protein